MKRKYSPWRGRAIVNDGVNVIQSRQFPLPLRPKADDKRYTVQAGDTITRIATRFYGDPLMWWVIVDKNAVDYPLEITPGMVLIIPALASIDQARRSFQ